MGKIKSKFIRRTAKIFSEKDVKFSEDFVRNKEILQDTMPSKKVRNQMAGFLCRFEKQAREAKPDILKKK